MYEQVTTHKFKIELGELMEMIKFYYVSQGFKWPIGIESCFHAGDDTYLNIEVRKEEKA